MDTLARTNVTLVDTSYPSPDSTGMWLVRIADVDYQIIARAGILGDRHTYAVPLHPNAEDPRSATSVHGIDHWACIDRLLAWLSASADVTTYPNN